jgi:hypothetical protein
MRLSLLGRIQLDLIGLRIVRIKEALQISRS